MTQTTKQEQTGRSGTVRESVADVLNAIALTAASAWESGHTEEDVVRANWDVLGPRLARARAQ